MRVLFLASTAITGLLYGGLAHAQDATWLNTSGTDDFNAPKWDTTAVPIGSVAMASTGLLNFNRTGTADSATSDGGP